MVDRLLEPEPLQSRRILQTRVDATSYRHATDQVLDWAAAGESRYVCVATVNNLIEGWNDPGYNALMEAADLVTPDGMPLVCEAAARRGIPVGFYGGQDDVLDDLAATLTERYEGLRIAYRWSPPFRPLTAEEEARVSGDLARSGTRILFVGLGTPKQERWMAGHKDLPMVMLGVGAAFDFLSGRKRQAPPALQRLGLEWLYRLVHEPRRLWRRYLYRNPRFVALFAAQLVRQRQSRRSTR
jgi:N-acetylglucosaminyldiphosphoundecaprenol N-acetyl-beta-D-mannosaminyltransferase